jgi:thiamine biosynthesis lipoprotein
MTTTCSLVQSTRPAMGTLFEALLIGDDREHLDAVAAAVLDEVERIERLLSRFDPRSEISRLNRHAGERPVLVDRELFDLLAVCLDAGQATGGAFDIAAVSRPAGFYDSPIRLDASRRLVQFALPEIQLDLGGIGKGYALDRAAEILASQGVTSALIHGGTSSVLARGLTAECAPWRIDIGPAASSRASTIELKDEALSCSAVDSQADIIDPASGRPLVASRGCGVIALTATEAEILSTALLCMPPSRAARFAAQRHLNVVWFDNAPPRPPTIEEPLTPAARGLP